MEIIDIMQYYLYNIHHRLSLILLNKMEMKI